MPDENEQNKERSKISLRVGEVQVELEGTYGNIKKLMDKELFDFTKGMQGTAKQLPSSTEITPEVTPKAPEVTPKEKTAPPSSRPSTTSKGLPKSPRAPTTGKMLKKKIVSRPAAIALLMACIVLSAGLVGVIAVYLPMASSLESQVTEKDSIISSLNTEVSALQSSLDQVASNLSAKNSEISNLTSQMGSMIIEYNNIISDNDELFLEYDAILALNMSGIMAQDYPVTQDANSSSTIWSDVVNYAGYVTVEGQSTSNTTYAEVVYSSYGVNYVNNVTLGTSGAASFPVLPGEIMVIIGNTDTYIGDSVNATVTATYYY